MLYIQTIKNTQLWCHEKGRKKRRRKREKKNVFRVSDFCFFEKARDNFKKKRETRDHFFHNTTQRERVVVLLHRIE